ncbi:hypothetical protein BS78_05G106600 [Paspalum vaginatum]|nr:hypothetical protein BS78_05G106600 [Paspalum vaginatum]
MSSTAPAGGGGPAVHPQPLLPHRLRLRDCLANAKWVLNETSNTPKEAALRLADIKEAASVPEDHYGDDITVPKGPAVRNPLDLSPTSAICLVLVRALYLLLQ